MNEKDKLAIEARREYLDLNDVIECSTCGFKGTYKKAMEGHCHLYKKAMEGHCHLYKKSI